MYIELLLKYLLQKLWFSTLEKFQDTLNLFTIIIKSQKL